MNVLTGLLLTIGVLQVQPSDGRAALHLVEEFASAVRRDPPRARDFAAPDASIDFGDFVGGWSIDRFAGEANKCRLQSITEPPVPKTWKLDGARYFRVKWRCPPPFGPRRSSTMSLALFVKQKIVAGSGHFE
ncbi:hypothetical protein [Sphingomonas sp. MS122]|uniref:hypothetical protein n=1 Tax=Sphingomonas sp. MS122 TaxID=3412683 RepID=UPI003C2F3E53